MTHAFRRRPEDPAQRPTGHDGRDRHGRRHKRQGKRTGAPAPVHRASDDMLAAARWMDFHESVLMPARRHGGADEVRRVLREARAKGSIRMTDPQIEREVGDVMCSPDPEAHP